MALSSYSALPSGWPHSLRELSQGAWTMPHYTVRTTENQFPDKSLQSGNWRSHKHRDALRTPRRFQRPWAVTPRETHSSPLGLASSSQILQIRKVKDPSSPACTEESQEPPRCCLGVRSCCTPTRNFPELGGQVEVEQREQGIGLEDLNGQPEARLSISLIMQKESQGCDQHEKYTLPQGDKKSREL